MTIVAIDTATRARLAWLKDQLTKLHEYQYVRFEGDPIFQSARQDLADILANAVEPVTNPPATIMAVMTPEQVESVIAAIPAGVDADAIVKAITGEIEQVELVDAVAATRADVLAAFPTNVQAVATEPAPAEEPK